MKSATEYCLENGAYFRLGTSELVGFCEFSAEGLEELIKKIQLEAYKEGLSYFAREGDESIYANEVTELP